MKYKIGIFGSSSSGKPEAITKAAKLGEEVSRRPNEIIIVTGACSGVPYEVAHNAKAGGVEIWGFAPARNPEEHKSMMPDDDLTIYDKIRYVPGDIDEVENKRVRMKSRNVTSTSICDAGIIIAGRWGSLNEFTNLVDFQKVIGVLTGTGGVADVLPDLTKKISKEGQGPIVFDDDPVKLLEKVLAELKSRETA